MSCPRLGADWLTPNVRFALELENPCPPLGIIAPDADHCKSEADAVTGVTGSALDCSCLSTGFEAFNGVVAVGDRGFCVAIVSAMSDLPRSLHTETVS